MRKKSISKRDRYLLAGIIFLFGLLIISLNLPKAFELNIDLGNDMVFGGMNVANNPSFEEGKESPQGWNPVAWRGSASFLWVNQIENVRTGNRSLMIQSFSNNVLCAWQSSERIDVKPGFIYNASVWVKIERVGVKGVHLGLAWFDLEGNWISVSGSEVVRSQTKGWTEIWVSAIPPQNAAKSSLELHLNDEGIVFFDDVCLEESIPDFADLNGWLLTSKDLPFAKVEIQNSTLEMSAQFNSPGDEALIFQRNIEIDPISHPFLTLSWRTSTNRPGDPGIFLEFLTASGRTFIQPLGFSKEWTTSTINLNVFAKGDRITGVRFMLNDYNDSIASGLFSIQLRGIYLSSIIDLRNILLILVTFAVFVLVIIDAYKRNSKLNKAILMVANISFMSTIPSLALPFYRLPGVEVIPTVGVAIVFCLTLLKWRIKNEDPSQVNNARLTNYIVLSIGLLTIPWLAFLLRLNYANLPTLFSDETSYGIMSWGLLNGKLVGLHFPGPWLGNVPSFFRIEEYPINLALPYTLDWMQNLQIVSPFPLPFLCPLISAPIIAFFGFTAMTIRFAYVLMSTLSVVFTFLIGRHFSNRIGLISAAVLAFTSFSVNFGSRAFMDNGVLLFFVVTVFLYLKFKETEKRRYLYSAAISAGLGTLTKLVFGFLPLAFLILTLFFDLKKRREIIKILPISVGLFSIFLISSLLVSYQGLIWSLSYFAGYAPKLALQGWMAQLLLILNYPELILGIICLVYVLRGKDDFTKLLKLLLLSSMALIVFAKPMWLLPILPLLSLGIAEAISHGSDGNDAILKRFFLLIFAALATKDLPIVREFFVGFFAVFLVLAIIAQFTTSFRFGFLKNERLSDVIWITLITVLFAMFFIQNILMMPLA